MPEITIYTKSGCSYCDRAKALLKRKGASYSEIEISNDPVLRDQMITRANGRSTVPQIFIDDHHVGGCDELHQLEEEGKLDPMLV